MALKTATKPKSKPATKSKTAATPAKAAAPAVEAPKAKAAVITFKQLAASLADRQEMAPKQVGMLLDDLIALIVDRLAHGDRLRIGGLGTLEIKDRPARTGRNPATGATIQIQASKKVAFRAAKELKDAV